jgi:hypothetical protein
MISMAARKMLALSATVLFVTGCDFFARMCPDKGKTDPGTTQDTGSVTGGDTGSITGGDSGSITGGDAGGTPGDIATFIPGNASGAGARVIIKRGTRSPRKGRVDTLRLNGSRVYLSIR